MAWKIIFSYHDGGEISVSSGKTKLSKSTAENYQKRYAKPSNDGGMVYVSPYRTCTPIPLSEYIANQINL